MCTYLVGQNESTKEDPLIGPLLEGDLKMRLSAVDVDEGNEESGNLDLSLLKNLRHKLCEL